MSRISRKVPVADARCEEILGRFRQSGDCPADWPDDWELLDRPMVRRESTVCRLGSARAGKSICIKIVHRKPDGSENSGSLFEALRHYHARSDARQGFTVPEPYGWVPEHHAVIMEWVDGRNFNEILKREWFLTGSRHRHLRQAAGWLRWFHSQFEVEQGTLAKRLKLKATIQAFDAHPDVDAAVKAHDEELREFLVVAKIAGKKVQSAGMDLVDLHGDFKPTNLLVSRSGAVVGIDFKGSGRGAATHDICRFLSDIDFHRNLVGRSFALGERTESNDFEVFLAAYGGRPDGLERPHFVYLYFLTIVRGMVYQRRKFTGGAGFRLRQVVVRGLARKLSREVSRTLLADR